MVVRPGPMPERYLSGSNVLWRFLAIFKDRIIRDARLASFAHAKDARMGMSDGRHSTIPYAMQSIKLTIFYSEACYSEVRT